MAVVEASVFERLEHPICGHREDRVPTPRSNMTDRVRDKRLAHADRPDDGHVRAGLDETKRRQLVEERAIEGDLGALVPALQLHVDFEARTAGAGYGGNAVAPGDLVLEREQEEVLVGHLLLARE